MPPVPEFCEQCGRQARNPVVNIRQATDVRISNVTGRCDYCGGRTRVIDGAFDFRDGLIEMLSGPSWSRDRLRQLQGAVRTAQQLAYEDPAGAVAVVERSDGRTGAFLRRTLASKELVGLTATLTVLLTIINMWLTLYIANGDKISEADVQRIVDQAIEQMEMPPTPGPQPPSGERGMQPPSPWKQGR